MRLVRAGQPGGNSITSTAGRANWLSLPAEPALPAGFGRRRCGPQVSSFGFIPMARVRLEGLHGGVCGERQPRGGRGQPAGVLEDAAGRSFPAELAEPPSQAMTMT